MNNGERARSTTTRRDGYKRPFDLTLLTVGFVALFPLWLLLGVAIALAIRLEDGGRVLYRQQRLGRGGRRFLILKFRTMVENAEAGTGPVWADRLDSRSTAVGRVLRRYHLDELPQALNVLRGEMSLVGPRPERPELAERFERQVPGFARRLEVRPGIAGLAQARAGPGLEPHNKLRYDLLYIAAMGPWLDLQLCAVCAVRALCGSLRHRGDGAPGDQFDGERGEDRKFDLAHPPGRGTAVPDTPDPDRGVGPLPSAVRYNDWRQVPLPDAGAFTPALPVSVIVPCFEAPDALALTLAGLERQRWPRDLFEVVIVDDGSQPPLTRPAATPLDVRVVRQDRCGFGLARARNAGVRAATHGILVFLDGDVIPEDGLLAAHARWHHAVSDAVTLGFCAYVSVAGITAAAVRDRPASLRHLLADRPFDPPWLERHMARTDDLTSRHDDLFRAVTGHNFGISKAFYDDVGGFDESFTRYGGEDTEFGYRAHVRGGLLVPVREAAAWHQGRWGEGRAGKERDQDRQRGKLAQLIADPGFRDTAAGRIFAVPRHVVTIDGGTAATGQILATASALLADRERDLVVRVDLPAGRTDARHRLEASLGADPRLRVAPARGALDEFPASPFHVNVPADPTVVRGAVPRLRAALGDGAAARGVLGGARVSIARAWALHRARRTGDPMASFGDVRTVRLRRPGLVFGLPWRAWRPPGSTRPRRGVRAAVTRVWAEARHVRGWRTGWRFLRWLVAAVRWRLRARGGEWEAAPVPAPAQGDPPLGVELAALGARAQAVFAASSRVAHMVDGRHVNVALADAAAEAAGLAAPVVLLSAAPSLSVPAFDPAVHNPIGWVRDVEPRVAALGPVRLLPAGIRAHQAVAPGDREALLHCHHLEDVAAFHADPATRAGTLARLAACGVPVHLADRDPALEPLLGAELHALMTADLRGAGPAAREALSIGMRRAALRAHSLRGRARQVCAAARIDPPPLPRVSVLLATRRPARLAGTVAHVAAQRYPHLELVLALHGPGFEAGAVEGVLADFAHPVKLLRLDADLDFGSVLNAATAAASGALVAKMDDDDVYGPEHLWDLVLAHDYSGADLVGKFPATVYLARRDRTVRRRAVTNETWSRSITGGTLLLAPSALERAGGWRRVRRHVDLSLIDDILGTGGTVYRTHDAGYLMVRHGARHTWEADDDYFLAGAETVLPGWRPELAGIEQACPPHAPAAGDGPTASGRR